MLGRLGLALIALCLSATAATAQWRFERGTDEARALVRGDNGSSMVLRCGNASYQRGLFYLSFDLLGRGYAPSYEIEGSLHISNWTFDIELNAVSGAQAPYQRFSGAFDAIETENFRRMVAAGWVATLDGSAFFAGTRFSLRGSRNAMEQLEAACQFLWQGGSLPTQSITPPRPIYPVPQPGPRPVPAPVAPSAAVLPPNQPVTVPAEALAALQHYIDTLIAPHCGTSGVTMGEGMYALSGHQVTVRTANASCSWTAGSNPFCSGHLCSTWVYAYQEGGSFDLIDDRLR